MSTMPSWLRRAWNLAGLSRLRWDLKLRVLRFYGVSLRAQPKRYLSYLLLDPELSNFTYELGNPDELSAWLEQVLDLDRNEIERHVQEGLTDQRLRSLLRRKLRWRLDRKRAPLYGRRLGWFVIARALKPGVVVETGIHDGLGSALLLRALELNAAEGHSGRLISVDINPSAGWLVDDTLRAAWTPVYGSTFDVLPPTLEGLEVGMFIHDSDHTYECERFEFDTAARNAASTLALVSDNAHGDSALRDVCADLGTEYQFFPEKPAHHFYPGAGIGFGLVRRSEGDAPSKSASSEHNPAFHS